ncbi:helix-turn-helix transcriptional regulator [Streptomyces fuscigenes]|uniref:helix-turn-helix transcriptional regulator n=1 Tax=Streptomyces fuscigenes TaxID=1528880 RepID=UPI001F1E3D2C|nr:helix-turn-helix transcriptional regulator [Streptomyces fuscigenes]MCF3960675.1 helix-turn-helix transcriptional regulator [Streptomyces fuscigenes]
MKHPPDTARGESAGSAPDWRPTPGTRAGDRGRFGDFLRRRRAGLLPRDVGLDPGTRRRTPGLRRDEVAALANMSTAYYESLEQARGPQPSASMLAGIATALRLTPDERSHLYLLAGQAPPAPVEPPGYVDPALLYTLNALAPTTPSLITDDLANVVAQSPMNLALFGSFTGRPGHEGNLTWVWFTSPHWRSVLRSLSPLEEEEETSLSYVADLRATLAQRGHDGAATTLIRDLRAASAEFAGMWDQHRVATLHCPTKIVFHDQVGRLDLDCVFLSSPASRQRLLMLQPVRGTETVNRLDRLHRLLGGGRPADDE